MNFHQNEMLFAAILIIFLAICFAYHYFNRRAKGCLAAHSANESLRQEVARRALAEQALRESEAGLRSTLQNMPAMMDAFDEKGRIIVWNQECERVTGFNAEEIIGNPGAAQLLYPDEGYRTFIIEQLTKYGSNFRNLEWDISCKDGSKKTILWSNMSEQFPVPGWYSWAVGFDITERKQAEESLKQSQRELEAFFSQSLDGFFFMMLDEAVQWGDAIEKERMLDYVFAHQRITKVNDAMLAQYGAAREQLLGLTPNDFFAHDLPRGRAIWREFFDRGRIEIETDERKLDGTVMWIEGEYVCLYDEEGRIRGHIGFQREITDRKQMEESLRKSEASLAEAQGIAHLGNWDWDIVKNEVWWSDEIYRISGLAPQEFAATYEAFLQTVHPDDREFVKKSVENALHKKKPYSIDHRIVLPDGAERIVHEQAKVSFDEARRPIRMIGTVQDITERKGAEEALRKRTEEIELLYEAGRKISQTLDTDAIYGSFYDLVSSRMDCDCMIISSYDPEEKLIRCAYLKIEGNQQDVSDFPPLALNPDGQGTQSVAISAGRSFLIRDYLAQKKTAKKFYYVDKDGGLTERGEAPEDEDVTRSALIVPMKLEGQVRGAVQVMSYQLDAYSEANLNTLEALISQIAVAGNNALLYQQAQEELAQRKEVEEALQKLNAELDERVRKRTEELQKFVNLMAGREVRMAELKKVIKKLRAQLQDAGIMPAADDPLLGS